MGPGGVSAVKSRGATTVYQGLPLLDSRGTTFYLQFGAGYPRLVMAHGPLQSRVNDSQGFIGQEGTVDQLCVLGLG